MPGEFVTYAEAAKITGLSPYVIWYLVRNGTIPSLIEARRDGSEIRRLRRSTVEAFAAAGCPRNGQYQALLRRGEDSWD
jgi:hypothetical protein